MPIDFEVSDINGVDEEVRPAYVERDGKFILDPDRYHEIKAAPLLKKNAELLNEKKKLAESTRTLEEKSKSGLGDIEKQLQERDKEIAGLKSQVREHSIWGPVKDMALKYGVMPDRINAFMTLMRTSERFDMEENKLVFKDRNGYPTTIKPERAFEVYLREEEPWAFEASKAAGSGAQNGNRTPAGRIVTRGTFDTMSQAAQDALMREVAAGKARLID